MPAPSLNLLAAPEDRIRWPGPVTGDRFRWPGPEPVAGAGTGGRGRNRWPRPGRRAEKNRRIPGLSRAKAPPTPIVIPSDGQTPTPSSRTKAKPHTVIPSEGPQGRSRGISPAHTPARDLGDPSARSLTLPRSG